MKNPRTIIERKPSLVDTRNTVLITRVSTSDQADNDEGSLKNQLQRLRAYMDYRRTCGEDWLEVNHIEFRAISGKDSVRSQEFQVLYGEVRTGRANTVLCPSIDRICRSVTDFLNLFEFLNQHGVEFISLREQFDTTTPQGRFVATILMAMAQMEREITSQRTSEAMADRAERGLWNGGQLLGYDLDPDRPGYPTPNPAEALLVNLAFDTYLDLGSIKETAETLTQRGYRTKSFQSRRGIHRGGNDFGISSMQHVLKNPAYLGKKEISQIGELGEERRLVDAVWSPIVSEEKFQMVQRLMADNGQTHRSGASSVQHAYSLSGLVYCKRCDGKMGGESGTGRDGTKYFYYRCSNRECRMRVAAREVEGAIVDRLQLLADDPELLERLTTETNRKLRQGRPKLEREKSGLEKDIKEVMTMADKLLSELVSMDQQAGKSFVKDKLNDLGQRQTDLEHGLGKVQQELDNLDRESVDTELVRAALGKVKELFGVLKPYEQRELMNLVLHRAEVNEREITLEVFALTGTASPGNVHAEGDVVRTRPNWLPE